MGSWGPVWGFKGLFFVRQAEKSLERSRGQSGALRRVLWLCGGRRSPWGAASWPAGRARGSFELLQQLSPKAGARRLDHGAPRACASSPSGGSSKRCVGCFSSGVHLVCDLRLYFVLSPRWTANFSGVLDSRKRRSPSLLTPCSTSSRRESFQKGRFLAQQNPRALDDLQRLRFIPPSSHT